MRFCVAACISDRRVRNEGCLGDEGGVMCPDVRHFELEAVKELHILEKIHVMRTGNI